MRYVVETRMGNTWEAVWSEDQEPMTFASEEEAEVEIAETLEDLQEAYELGDMSSPMSRDEFRIVVMRYVVETLRGSTWQVWPNAWSEDQEPMTFVTEEEAKAEIEEILEMMESAWRRGDLSSPMTRDEFRIVAL